VLERYAPVLNTDHQEFLDRFSDLPFPAQCLYVRIAGRKGSVFDLAKLPYPEIPDIFGQAERLHQGGLAFPVGSDDFPAFLNTLTKPDLIGLLHDHLCASAFKRSWKKSILVETALAHLDFNGVQIPDRLIVQGGRNPLAYLSFLYFGKITENLQRFTLRDLGLVKTPDFKTEYEARFDTPDEADSAFFFASALHDFKHGCDDATTGLIDTLEQWPAPIGDQAIASRDKLLQKLGGLAERLNDIDTAVHLYAQSDTPLCNERLIRLRYARGDQDWCRERLEALIENPGTDDEYYFAEDFYRRKFKKKRTSRMTELLRSGESLELEESFRGQPEYAAAKHYERRGWTATRTENGVWRMLFGLLFWDEIYCSKHTRIHNSFERLPADLKSGAFYELVNDSVEEKLAGLADAGKTHIQLLKTMGLHHGTPNGIFRWSGAGFDSVQSLLTCAPPDALAHMLRLMAKNYAQSKVGFPDLMLVRDNDIRFIEVKAEGDVIRRNQLTRIQQLRAAGLKADIARINWVMDPKQIYVVVDVETTGGRAGNHRVTEIGAVKVQNGHVIDEFQTLLNPERAIPANITTLTGISNEMVKDAPLFESVADDFATFLEGSIFVAHNVGFDYGFIGTEFGRLGRQFRMPKMCTVASMRKMYPGHKSYSLKNLCREYHIDLNSHHRALCDAKAATELLFLVNEKRVELSDK
ncbi:MAG: DNA polymerase III subunit epsilon, partial [Acidimicrobiales bacterium]